MATITKGTYVWSSTPALKTITQYFSFFSYGSRFDAIKVSLTGGTISYYLGEGGESLWVEVYNEFSSSNLWSNDKYKTIEVTSDASVDDTFYTWFNSNVTKQEEPSQTTHKLTFDSNCIVTVNGSSITSGYGLKNGDVIVVKNIAGELATFSSQIDVNDKGYYENITLDIANQDIALIATQGFNQLTITINYTEATTPAYTFKHYHRSNVLIGSSGSNYVFRPYTIIPLYSIAISVENCTQDSNNVDRIYENGSVTLKFIANSGFALPDSVSASNATSSWNKASGELTISSPTSDLSVSVVAVEDAPKIATVTGLGNSDPTTVTFDVPSDFKFTDGEYTDESGNVFVKIPKMYRKVNTVSNGQITSFSISNVKVDDNYKIYPVFLAEDGVIELDWVGIGKYMSKNSDKVDSVVSGTVTKMTLGNARTNIKNNYSYGKYQLYDWMFHKLWQDLIICKMQTINTNSGSGITTDQLGIYWGNFEQWIDGFGHEDTYVYLCDKPSKYVDSPTASTDGYFTTNYRIPTTSGQEVQKLGYDEMHPFVTLPVATTRNSSYNTYYCDYYYYGSGNRSFYCSVGNAVASYGAFGLGGVDWSVTDGVRLCYRPLGN